MKTMATPLNLISWAVLGAIVSLATIFVAAPSRAAAVPGAAYVYRGIALEPQWCSYWGSGNDDAWKLAQLWYIGTHQYIRFFALSGSNCNGVRVEFYHDSGKTLYAGDLHYLHVIPYGGVIGSGYDVSGGDHYYRDLGEISGSEPIGCYWDGAHLHQSANTSASTAFYTNWDGDVTTDWVHKVQ